VWVLPSSVGILLSRRSRLLIDRTPSELLDLDTWAHTSVQGGGRIVGGRVVPGFASIYGYRLSGGLENAESIALVGRKVCFESTAHKTGITER